MAEGMAAHTTAHCHVARRDGVGTMISADFYEGIRRAHPADLDGVRALLRPLEEAGICVKRGAEEIANLLPDFIVIERETKLMGCALLLPLGPDAQGVPVAEVGVNPFMAGFTVAVTVAAVRVQ